MNWTLTLVKRINFTCVLRIFLKKRVESAECFVLYPQQTIGVAGGRSSIRESTPDAEGGHTQGQGALFSEVVGQCQARAATAGEQSDPILHSLQSSGKDPTHPTSHPAGLGASQKTRLNPQQRLALSLMKVRYSKKQFLSSPAPFIGMRVWKECGVETHGPQPWRGIIKGQLPASTAPYPAG